MAFAGERGFPFHDLVGFRLRQRPKSLFFPSVRVQLASSNTPGIWWTHLCTLAGFLKAVPRFRVGFPIYPRYVLIPFKRHHLQSPLLCTCPADHRTTSCPGTCETAMSVYHTNDLVDQKGEKVPGLHFRQAILYGRLGGNTGKITRDWMYPFHGARRRKTLSPLGRYPEIFVKNRERHDPL